MNFLLNLLNVSDTWTGFWMWTVFVILLTTIIVFLFKKRNKNTKTVSNNSNGNNFHFPWLKTLWTILILAGVALIIWGLYSWIKDDRNMKHVMKGGGDTFFVYTDPREESLECYGDGQPYIQDGDTIDRYGMLYRTIQNNTIYLPGRPFHTISTLKNFNYKNNQFIIETKITKK